MSILITGASGFIGRALCLSLQQQQQACIPIYRNPQVAAQFGFPNARYQAEIHADSPWQTQLAGVQVVVHLAARVHVMHDQASDPLIEYRRSNRDATLNLARQAAQAGVKRFVFLSSIKVNGEASLPGQPFRAEQTPHPLDPYGISKWEAEQALLQLGRDSGMEIVIIRPPLVYGPGVKANFLQLMRWVEKGVPLPLASIKNQRSMVYLGNLLDLIVRCIQLPQAAGQTFLVSDGKDVSTAELIRALAQALHRPARLFGFPPALLKFAATLVGREAAFERLSSSLQVDISATCQTLQWQPPFTMQQGLAITAQSMQTAHTSR